MNQQSKGHTSRLAVWNTNHIWFSCLRRRGKIGMLYLNTKKKKHSDIFLATKRGKTFQILLTSYISWQEVTRWIPYLQSVTQTNWIKFLQSRGRGDPNIKIKQNFCQKLINKENVKASCIRSPNLIIRDNISLGIKTKYVMMPKLLSIVHPVLLCIILTIFFKNVQINSVQREQGWHE